MECYFNGNNQFYTIGGLILLGISLSTNIITCVYWSRKNNNKKEQLITSNNYVEKEDNRSDVEMGEDKSTNTSPHVCSIRRFTPFWISSQEEKVQKYKAELPDWAMNEYINGTN